MRKGYCVTIEPRAVPMPTRSLCVLHANCQGEPLAQLLRLSPDFERLFYIQHYLNYTREPVPQDAMTQAEVFIYQHLGPQWEGLSSAVLQQQLGPKARSFCIPNMFFKGYWPFWTSHSPIDFGDAVLDKLIDAKADKAAILKIYVHGDIHKFTDPDAEVAASLEKERQKERMCDVPIASLVEEFWRDECLFYTVNHPGKRLLFHVAEGVLHWLGLPPLPHWVKREYEPEYAEFELPIHPQLAEHFALPFARPGHLFRIFARKMDFARYVSRYIDCRQHDFQESFQAYLQLV